MFTQEILEENVPILKLIADTLVRDPHYSIDLLDITARRLLLLKYRQERNNPKSVADALEKARGALWCSHHDTEDLLALAQLLANEERLEEAMGYLEKPLELFPDNGNYHRFKTSLLERQHRFKEALLSIKRTRQLLPEEEELRTDQKRIQERLLEQLSHYRNDAPELRQRIEAAREIIYFKKELEADSNDNAFPSPQIASFTDLLEDQIVLVGLLAEREGPEDPHKLTEAISVLDQIISKEPERSVHYQTRIALLLRLKKYRSALRTVAKVCQLNFNLQKFLSTFLLRYSNKKHKHRI
ncbi:MAG: hypothetical protein ACOYK6_02985 [Chthoniobacterales bacterium]